MTEAPKPTHTVTIPLELAKIIDRAFLPTNPNKMRGEAKENARRAAIEFKSAIRAATPGADDAG